MPILFNLVRLNTIQQSIIFVLGNALLVMQLLTTPTLSLLIILGYLLYSGTTLLGRPICLNVYG